MEPMERKDSPGGTHTSTGLRVDWRAVGWGAGAGVAVLIVAATAQAILDHRIDNFDDSGWTYAIFVLILLGYATAGWVATCRAGAGGRDAPLTHGALAGLGAFVVWIPIRIAIWLARDEDRGLFRGSSAALRPGQVFGHLVIAAGIGMLGAWLAARTIRGRSSTAD
jgi:hypothetical protein